ncbi:MAG TPA: 3,4-dihydroxy-2-butanone-4-phosphate synthase [Gammaproteobacteria bacterium]|nr:3,4-dihydroxy-2-butanone-4-phosphate synthase [Gammaproteobacteria bacterium]
MALNSTEEIIEDLRQGKMVVIMDDEDRENEGDLLMPAAAIRSEDLNFMTHHGRGLVCLTLTRERCQRLQLPLMPKSGDVVRQTNFTVSIDAARGVSTGISAADRTTTIRAATSPDAKPEDLAQPGHIFPLMAEDGGVLVRAGHTEAGCDLARLAGFEPAAVIVEILNEDGSMARRPDLERFCATHGMKLGTIEDLIRYRYTHETMIERVQRAPFRSVYGEFELVAFRDHVHGVVHTALVKGPLRPELPTLVRVHVENPLYDVFAGEQDIKRWPVADALRRIARAEQGVFVYLTEAHSGTKLLNRIQEYISSTAAPAAAASARQPEDLRSFGIGAQILSQLGVRRMKLLSAPKIFHGLGAFGLEIMDYVSD